jgi:hypothetical protein
MNTRLSFIVFAVAVFSIAHGTEQESDVIVYRGDRCELDTHWMFPSPLQVYFLADETRDNPLRQRGEGFCGLVYWQPPGFQQTPEAAISA